MAGRGTELGGLALGRGGQLVGLAPGGSPERIGLALGGRPLFVGLALGVRAQFGSIVLGACPQLCGIDLGCGLDLAGFRSSGLDHLGCLFLGKPQQLLDPGAEAGIGGSFPLVEPAAGFGQVPLHGLGLLAVLPHFGFDLPDVLVDLMTVVAPHRRHEVTRLGFLEGIIQLSVNIRLHVA